MNTCRREIDIYTALDEIPTGMEAIYDRMASSILTHHSKHDFDFAIAVLEHVLSSVRTLSLSELSQALGDTGAGILDLQHTIVDLCCGLIVVDCSGQVTMVHQTAREYFSGTVQRPFTIETTDAHKRAFASCIRCLTMTGLRAKTNRDQKSEYLDYAATSWSFHLAAAPSDCRETWNYLQIFLTRQSVLTWIDYLARTKQLRVLVQTSRNLSKYTAKRKALSVGSQDEARAITELELVASWSADLVKVAGRFGPTLLRQPDSIYKHIAPFCPQSSSIYQLFGKQESRNLAVKGLSRITWDDSLSRIAIGDRAFASRISVAGHLIAILDSSGTIFLYDSSTFEELPSSPLKHGERLYTFEANQNGSVLVTYGYRTTKIWDSKTGTCKICTPNPLSKPRPLAMRFSIDSKTLSGGWDDGIIRSLTLNDTTPGWQDTSTLEEVELSGHVLNAANFMTMSKEGDLTAVAYRGYPLSAWETEGPVHIGYCWRKRDPGSRGEVVDANWLPHSPEVLGLYIEGVVFKWSPYEDRVEEMHVGAAKLAVSQDGRLFATGDGAGSIKVFTTSGFGALYELAAPDSVFDIAFSPNSQRLYDVRGYYASVWEPNVLVKYSENVAEGSDSASETESIARTTATNVRQNIDSVTVLATSPKGTLYCYGTEAGVVTLCHIKRGPIQKLQPGTGFLSIEKMTFSSDGGQLCFSDSSKKVAFYSLNLAAHADDLVATKTGDFKVNTVVKGPVTGLMFCPDSERVLIQATSSVHVASLSPPKVIRSLDLEHTDPTWVLNPADTTKMLGFSTDHVTVVDWELTHPLSYRYHDKPKEAPVVLTSGIVDRVVVANLRNCAVVQVSDRTRGSRNTSILSFDFETFSAGRDAQNNPIQPRQLILSDENPARQLKISRLLGILSKDMLGFLSDTNSLCSWQMSSGMVKELFYLPSDWIRRECLGLCTLWSVERAFLCPKDGEIAVVTSSNLG